MGISVSVAICEDDVKNADYVEEVLSSLTDGTWDFSCDVFFSGTEMLAYLDKTGGKYNIYLLDIEMPGQNGIETAARVRKQDRDAVIIFITDHKEYVYEIFETLPFRFLRKPVDREALKRTLLDAAEHIRNSQELFFFQIGRDQHQLFSKDIQFFEGAGRKMVLHTETETFAFYGKASDVLLRLDTGKFCRIHASYIVNMEYIRSIIKQEVVMQNGTVLPISKHYLQEVRKEYLAFIERGCGNV